MKCMKCSCEMITAKLCGDVSRMSVRLTNKKKGVFETEHISTVSCFVCTKCGYVELKADNPKDLIL